MGKLSTPSQTVGPFFAVLPDWPQGQHLVPEGSAGAVWLRGQVFDGAGAEVPDALLELWVPGPPSLVGRCRTDPGGHYGFRFPRSGTPHLTMSVFARGLTDRVVTRVYFPDEPDANAADPVLQTVTDPLARATLVARAADDGYRFDIHLQGPHETVFFSC